MRVARTVAVGFLLCVTALAWGGPAAAAKLAITSPAFASNQPVPRRFACDGAGISPPLHFSGVPSGARSLVLVVDDPDAPSGDFVHWVLYNLAPDRIVLAPDASRRSLPGPAETAKNSAHAAAYHPLCPPKGDGWHHYRFSVYALDTRLPTGLDDGAAVQGAMHGHVLAHARLTGRYRRH